eukprot:2325688-Amphidinium_carterae.2
MCHQDGRQAHEGDEFYADSRVAGSKYMWRHWTLKSICFTKRWTHQCLAQSRESKIHRRPYWKRVTKRSCIESMLCGDGLHEEVRSVEARGDEKNGCQTGRQPVGTRWIDSDKWGGKNLENKRDLRSQLVVQETRRMSHMISGFWRLLNDIGACLNGQSASAVAGVCNEEAYERDQHSRWVHTYSFGI